ncbi:UDP-N-acetylmuramate dehydrogenase [Solimonas aquatica]|uniref:UDP-N-acetylenolpyruvoylglucosamine reductase n=1 Tax=Solimonas aquatica TaxID=489703 RepID=A0A1H9K1P5_9GAMM|nr:UDP-N-acetylmuramate dehydrogenase [Solimonas aquatica]SEQ93136.1 UDP-N-acetylmuramate dehydrogenase [Solimonas aquatica]
MNATARHDPVALRGRLLLGESLAAHTSWRVGGKADRYYEPADLADLSAFVASLPADEPLLWLGLGSNLLVRDGGVRGTVIALHGALDDLKHYDETCIEAQAGVHCARLAKFVVGHKLAGAGFFAGIPGTVGGALAMNAGAHGGETWRVVSEVQIMRRDGSTVWLPKSEFVYGYRHVAMPRDFAGFIAARFVFERDADGSAEADMKTWLARRKATQPVGKPSAGSTFRNPPDDHAARLIEACGLKGHRVGGAEVSTLHANFIITDEAARAADVEQLIAHIQQRVFEQTGVHLHPEVRVVGEPA